jgi:hypothetical protein
MEGSTGTKETSWLANNAPQVAGPTIPSTASPALSWKASIAPLVSGPKMPSTVIPSSRWMAATAGPESPCLSFNWGCSAGARCTSTTGSEEPAGPPLAATIVGTAGVASIAALIAIEALFRREVWRRPSSACSRR